MQRLLMLLLVVGGLPLARAQADGDPAQTITSAEQVLEEIMAIPGKAIPEKLLADAQGVAIIPNVIKIGFIAGARRGHGVVLVRDADGEWSLPQFITLTGGSVGWQAGIQGTDVVLVFTTRKGVEGLLRGKFTIGADAAASAGPVGRNAAAATDATLRSEILSYSRSRGLFLGVSVDGSALEIDNQAHLAYYGSQSSEIPRQIPQGASRLRQELVDFSTGNVAGGNAAAAGAPLPVANRQEALRRSLTQSAGQLHAILSPQWQQYLALPRELADPAGKPRLDTLQTLEGRFDQLAASADYRQLAQRPEFQSTHELLKAYLQQMSATSQPTLQLPPPPAGR